MPADEGGPTTVRPVWGHEINRGYRAGPTYRGYRYGVGAAGVGAYYRGGCGYDAYGNWVCPPC